MKALAYGELDIDYCALRYGESNAAGTCPAVQGVDSDAKCLNTAFTCPVRASLVNEPITLRFSEDADYYPKDIEAIPAIVGITYSPNTISLGKDLGERSQLQISFKDFRWSDTGQGFDKYRTERDYNPFNQGSFWGKFRARQPYLRGRPIRMVRGLLGDALADMERRHFVVESFNGPTPDGVFTIAGVDVLQLASGDRAQAPAASNGYLVAGIDDNDTALTLSPVGIGDEEYPASGYVAIGGKEICAFTRSGDVLTLTRAQYNTEAVAHDAEDRVQLCLRYLAQDPANIIADLLENYAGVDPDYLPVTSWLDETSNFYGKLLTSLIAEPTSVAKLLAEIVEQAALALWWDSSARVVKLQVLRAIATDAAVFSEAEHILEGTLSIAEQPDARISQVHTYYAMRNPLESADEPTNYRSRQVDIDAPSELEYGQSAIKTIYSRWIPEFGLPIAQRLNLIQLARFKVPPRRVTFGLFRAPGQYPVVEGGGYRLEAKVLQDAFGAPAQMPFQVTRLNLREDAAEVEAEEMLFEALPDEGSTERVIIINSDALNVNARAAYDTLYPAPTAEEIVRIIIQPGVTVGSASASGRALDIGDWPVGADVTLAVNGLLEGAGGVGGNSGGRADGTYAPATSGQGGGVALYTRFAITVVLGDLGKIRGGAGGGGGGTVGSAFGVWYGGGTGGGGAGVIAGSPGSTHDILAAPGVVGSAGTADAGGAGGVPPFGGGAGGAGGAPGMAGADGQVKSGGGPAGTGGGPGAAIDGVSLCTISGTGTRAGPEIN